MGYTPAYVKLPEKIFQQKMKVFNSLLSHCLLCPRNCGVNRIHGATGYCKAGKEVKIANHSIQSAEEPVISGTSGSGIIMFSSCEVGCIFCNTHPASLDGAGDLISVRELAEIMIELQAEGCHNLQLVTPTIYLPYIIKALHMAKESGLEIPLVYNSSGYDNPHIIRMLKGLIDIYMPDMKFASMEDSTHLAHIDNYSVINKIAITEMYSQVGSLTINKDGTAQGGLIVRHLVMPNRLEQTEEILRFISESVSKKTYVSMMGQYSPTKGVEKYPELARKLTAEEFEQAKK